MKATFKRLFHILKIVARSKAFIAVLASIVIVSGLVLVYVHIPQPSISDGYLMGEVRKLSVGSPITLRFSQSMDRASVEHYFSVSPKLSGSFQWPDAKTLQFIPDTELKAGETITVVIGAESLNWARKTLGLDTSISFLVSGPPFAKFISPYLPEEVRDTNGEILNPKSPPVPARAGEILNKSKILNPKSQTEPKTVIPKPEYLVIGTNQAVTVMFDRPMRALTALDEISPTPLLEITPPVQGSTHWIGSTSFQFESDRWTPATVYTLKLPKGIVALDGSSTQDEVVWNLATEAPRILSTTPAEGDPVFPVSGNLELRFNQSMDLDYIKPSDNILLYPSNDADADQAPKNDGFFNTEVVYGKDAKGKTDHSILVFKPEFKYQYNQSYKLVVKAGLFGAAYKLGQNYGERTMQEDFELHFKTINIPGIASYAPQNGATDFEPSDITIYFDSPMTKDLVKSQISLSPKVEKEPEIYVYTNGLRANIWYDLKPSTNYQFTFKGPFKDKAGNTAQKGFKTSFKTAPLKPSISLLTKSSTGLFTEGMNPVYSVRALNVKTLNLQLCALDESTFLSVSDRYGWYDYHCSNPSVKTVGVEDALNQSMVHALDLKSIFGREFNSGIYFFEVSSSQYIDSYSKKPYRFYQVFMVSDTALTLKKSSTDLLVWATDLKSGQPVSRMELKILNRLGKELITGVTDGNGIYKITKDFGDRFYVVGRKTLGGEDRWALSTLYWDEGIQAWQFNANGDWLSLDEPRIFLYTERPLYRAGDEVFFKGIYRLDRDAKLSLPTDKKINVVLEDPQYEKADSKAFTLLPDGSFHGSFVIGSTAKLGQYHLYAETPSKNYPQRFYADFFVEEYKKPKYKVELLSSAKDLIIGDLIQTDVQASYYFGGAIQGGKVHWSLMRDAYAFDRYEGQDYYSFGVWEMFSCFFWRCGGETRIVAEGDSNLDVQGLAHLSIPTDQETKPGMSYLYTLSVDVEDQDGEHVTARDSIIGHQGSFYVGLNIKDYLVQPKEEAKVNIITVSDDGKPVAGKQVTLELSREEWNTVKKQGVDGAFYEESVRDLKFVERKAVTTNIDPVEASFTVTEKMDGGRYIIQGKSTENGREILSETNFYVSSGGWVDWGSSNNNRMELIADKPEYFVGGKAKVLIQSPFGSKEQPAKALVTYERGTLHYYEVIDVTSSSDTLEVPITESMAPNMYVTVLVMKDASTPFKGFVDYEAYSTLKGRQSYLNNSIDRLKKEIADLQASTDAKSANRNAILMGRKQSELETLQDDLYKTMESLKTFVGQTPKEVAYELARPDFRMGVLGLRVNRREHDISIDLKTSKPDYRVGDTVEIEIHTRDYQNRPIPATLSMAVVDESLLALKANQFGNPLDYFLGPRALQVSTSSNLTLHVDRINLGSGKGSKGGDGGGADEAFAKKRGEFKDTAYYNPVIQTDEGGYAKISFKTPDNLTTWQILAIATAETDRFGMAKEDFVVKKPVSLSPILPAFVISGDQLTVGALVHNQSGQTQRVVVQLAADGFKLKSPYKQSVVLKDGATSRLNWTIEVKPISRDTSLPVEFRSLEDTVVTLLPAKIFAYPEVVALNGLTDNSQTEKVRVPSYAVPGMGGLDLSVGASLVAQFLSEVKALIEYPYGCAEQTISRVLPLIVFQLYFAEEAQIEFLKLIDLDASKNAALITDALQRLSKFQRSDGGYGFWQGSDWSYPILSAYIVMAQTLAKEARLSDGQAGFTINSSDYDRALHYLLNALNTNDPRKKLNLTEKTFVLWVLSEAKQNDTGMTIQIYEKREELPLYSRGLLLMNLQNLVRAGQHSVSNFTERLKSEIVSKQIIEDRLIHFEEAKTDYWDMNTNRRTTAIILMALNRDNTDNPILPNIVNYLTHSIPRHEIANSQESAWILFSIFQYAKSHNEFGSEYDFQVKLNGDKVLEGDIAPKNLFAVFADSLGFDKLHSGDSLNEIVFSKQGIGRMYYDLQMKYYLPNETVPPAEHGFYIERRYYPFEKGDLKISTTTFKAGELYRGELKIIVPEDMHFAVVEERLPAGFEAINFNLDTADASLQAKLEESTRPKGEYYWYDNPLWHFNFKETRDDRVLLFADELPKGVYTYNFLVRAGLPGKYHHLPASAFEMYFPELFGRTGGEWVEIRE